MVRLSVNLLVMILISGSFTQAQQTCKVIPIQLQGSYTGECKNGLAYGKGVAKGIDSFTGTFKKGYPDGTGTYTWSYGGVYTGSMKWGLMHGTGEYRHITGGQDTVLAGVWNKGKYMGPVIQKPVINSKQNISNVNFTRTGDGNKVSIRFMMASTYNASIKGLLININSGSEIVVGNEHQIRDVIFPFMCKIMYESNNQLRTVTYQCSLDFIINQPGEWEVKLENN